MFNTVGRGERLPDPGVSAMAVESDDERRTRAIRRAIELVTVAIDLIDAHGGPADAAAHLDLALHRLREELGQTG